MTTGFNTGIYNPDVLSCLANLSNDEVLTPPEVANQMLDLLPQELFKDPNITFFDPACKSGIFLREIAKRLLIGLKDIIPNQQRRIDHIFKKQLFGIAITELTSLLTRRSVYCSKFPNGPYSVSKFETPEGNIRFRHTNHTWNKKGKCQHCGCSREIYDRDYNMENHAYEFIHSDNPNSIFNKRFDVIISNPPYALTDGGGGSNTGAISIYQLFVQQALLLDPKYLLALIPSRWYSGGKGLKEFRELMLSNKHIEKLVDYVDSKDCFTCGVDIPGGICYLLYNKNYSGDCQITNINKKGFRETLVRPLDEYPTLIRQNKAVSIIQKILNRNEPLMSNMVLPRQPFGITSTKKFEPNGDVILRSSSGFGKIKKEQIEEKHYELVAQWKTIISKVTTEHAGVPDKNGKMRVLAVIEVLPPNSACTESYLVTGSFDNQLEANNLKEYLKTKFVRFLMTQMLSSMNMTKDTFSYVPIQDFKLLWRDPELYAKYRLTHDEITLIEESIKPMTNGDCNNG